MSSEEHFPSKHNVEYYEHISPTAFVIAYERTFTDIPLSEQIFNLAKDKILEGQKATSEGELSSLAPRYEARYKLVNKLLDESGNTNVIEIAPGLSPRGLTYVAKKVVRYVELDLPHMGTMKREIIEQVSNSLGIDRSRLIQVAGNALEEEVIRLAANELQNDKPVTFICEGLMRYLDFDEKRRLAENIHKVLTLTGGVWVTPDITLNSFNSGAMLALGQRVSDMSGINTQNNFFESTEHATTFFENVGFKVTSRDFLEVKDSLTSPDKLGMNSQAVDEVLNESIAFVMTPR